MGTCLRAFGVIVLLLSIVIYQLFVNISHPYKLPDFDLEEYWGPGNQINYKEDTSIIPNKLRFSNEVINRLTKRLNQSLNYLAEPLEGVHFEYGFNSKRLKKIVKYWHDDYMPRWRDRESYLWQFPHLTTQIQGLKIHFLHTKFEDSQKKNKKVFPVLLLHGWPGSVREFYDIIPKLIDLKSEYIFEVVAPSLPGYGWSEGASKTGLGPPQIAVIMRNLMLRLGYDKFFIQGGDWGSLIGSNMATMFPDNVIGYHSNMCGIMTPYSALKMMIAKFLPKYFVDKEYFDFYFPIGQKFAYIIEESGYFHLQATKPDTIGIVLSDNPIGLAAYILEKFSTWTNCDNRKTVDGGLGKDIKMDALLDNVMIYYLTDSITTSQRLYAEAFSKKQLALNMDRVPVKVPVGCARFKHDLAHNFDWQLEEKFTNLIHSTHHKKGGHFAALELPDILYKDFIEFVKKVDLLKVKSSTTPTKSAASKTEEPTAKKSSEKSKTKK